MRWWRYPTLRFGPKKASVAAERDAVFPGNKRMRVTCFLAVQALAAGATSFGVSPVSGVAYSNGCTSNCALLERESGVEDRRGLSGCVSISDACSQETAAKPWTVTHTVVGA